MSSKTIEEVLFDMEEPIADTVGLVRAAYMAVGDIRDTAQRDTLRVLLGKVLDTAIDAHDTLKLALLAQGASEQTKPRAVVKSKLAIVQDQQPG